MRPTPELFYQHFRASVSERSADLAALWPTSTAYTQFVRNEVLPDIGRRLGLQTHSSDYYTLDCVYYIERDTQHFPRTAHYAKCFSIALEHENVLASTCIEMNKLQLFNAPLKVLITYARSAKERAAYLAKYQTIIEGADLFGDVATTRRQLVLFGTLEAGSPLWRAYVYTKEGFTSLDGE